MQRKKVVFNKNKSLLRVLNFVRTYFFRIRFHINRFGINLFTIFLIFLSFSILIFSFSNLSLPASALNDTNKQWVLNTANASEFSYDPILVTVDNTGAHPANTVNKLTNSAFNTNNTSWSVSAVAGSTTPAGYAVVPGNAIYGTTDFLVMKYEAKCATNASPTVGLTSPADVGSGVYRDDGTGAPANNCTSANGRQVVSLASGYPIAYVSQTESATRCGTISMNGNPMHLINNNEWMTVARNAEAQPSNWSLGSVGSGYIYAGHSDNSPTKARIASPNDANRAAYTDAAGTTEALTTATNTANGESATVGNQVRTFNLSNGSVVWDIAGNLWEWTNDTILGKDQPTNATPGFTWREFPALTTYGTLSYDQVRPLSNTYNSSYGVGQIYSDGTVSNMTSYAFLRGGDWTGTSVTGAFAVRLSFSPALRLYFGFRCASDPVSILQSYSSISGLSGGGGDTITIGSITDGKITQSVNVGDTSTYDYSTYVYDNTSGNVGGSISSTTAQLWYNGATIGTTYTDASSTKGAGWWKLSGTLTGVNVLTEYGVLVKSGKTVKVDDFTLSKEASYSVFNITSYSNPQVLSWDTFCEGTLSGSVCTPDVTYSSSVPVKYQVCIDDGSVCESSSSWKYYNGSSWVTAINNTTNTNKASELTQGVMQALSTVSKKISVKAIFTFEGDFASSNFPKLPHISIGLSTDTVAPTGGSITYTDGYYTTASVSITVADGIDTTSGINTSSRIVQRKSSTLTNGTCESYGSFSTITPTGTYPNFTDSTVISENCYQYQYQVSDLASNQATYISANTVKVDMVTPTITGTPTSNTPTINTKPTLTWTASIDLGGSGLASPAYTLKWSKDSSFNTEVSSTTVNTNSYTIITDLQVGTWYFIVNAVDLSGNISNYSPNGIVVINAIVPINIINNITSNSILRTIMIKVVDINGNIVLGAKVVLDSGQIAFTDSNGIATFYNVIGTDHNIVISFGNTTITKDIVLSSNKNNFNDTIVLAESSISTSISSSLSEASFSTTSKSVTSKITSSQTSTNTSNESSISPIILVLLGLLVLGGVITFFFFKQKRND